MCLLVLIICLSFFACGEEPAKAPAASGVKVSDGIEGTWRSNEYDAPIGKTLYFVLQIDGEKFYETCYDAADDSVFDADQGPYEMDGTKVSVAYENEVMEGLMTVYEYSNGVLTCGNYTFEKIG